MRFLAYSFVAVSFVGCAQTPDIEDSENDDFLTDDAKADAFGVEDWSPDGAAVLKLVSEASASKLSDDVGLSSRVAKSIVAERGTLTGNKFDDLAQLDAAKYVGKTVFSALLRYATEHHLFKTALRVPLSIDDGNGNLKLISSFNTQAHNAGLTGFARYTFVDEDSKFSDKMDSYNTRLQELATKAHITIDGEMVMYASSLEDYKVGSTGVCYIGDAKDVADVSSSQSDSLMGDMYIVWGWRAGKTKFLDDQIEPADANSTFGDDWKNYSTSSKTVLIEATNSDDGDDPSGADVPPCR